MFLRLLGVEALMGTGLAIFGKFVAQLHYTDTINAGAIILGAIIFVLSGIMTIRSKNVKIWRGAWHDERELREERERQIQTLKEQIVAEREEQQVIRHELKNQLAEIRGQVAILKMKTDLSAHEALAQERHDAIMVSVTEELKVLQEIAATLLRADIRNAHEAEANPA